MRLHQDWCDDEGKPKWISSEELSARNNLSHSAMRIISSEAAAELQQLLDQVGTQHGVIGSLIVGHDGMLVACTLPPEIDAKLLAQKAQNIYQYSSEALSGIGHKHIHQFVGKTPHGYVVIADFGGGLLLTISKESHTNALIPLMRAITGLTGQ